MASERPGQVRERILLLRVSDDDTLSHTRIFSLTGMSSSSRHVDILKSVTITINAGEKVAIVGRTGRYVPTYSSELYSFCLVMADAAEKSGKSSLVQTLFGLLPRTRGSIQVDGIDLDHVPIWVLRERIAGLPQQSFCNGLATVRHNLDPKTIHSDAQVSELLGCIFADVKEQREFDLGQIWESCEFSPGWQQRLSIARVLLRKSAVYVFDEPTSG